MPPEIRRITDAFLHNPERVEVAKPATTNVSLTQAFVTAGREAHEKRDILRQLIRSAKDLQNAIIFCNRKREVALLHKSLVRHGFSAVALHGDMDQSARTAALDQFRRGETPLLVASDVAARGLDIPEVSHVYNFDVPHHADDYVHRVGRTGRAGRSGTAISIVAPIDHKSLAAIEKLIGQNIPKLEGFASLPSEPESDERRSSEGRGKRPRRSHGDRSSKPRNEARAPRRDHAPARDHAAPPAPKQKPPSIGRLPSRPVEPEGRPADVGDQSHLPAFLLRPTRARA
jgi:superfamily II DNA/RNA helicase